MSIRPATASDLEPLAALAAITFPLAAPADTAPEAVASFIEQHLSVDCFAAYVADRDRDVLVHERADSDGAGIDGYLMLVAGEPSDVDAASALTIRPTIELSKFYVSPEAHGQGLASLLMRAAFGAAEARGLPAIWLGVNRENARAQSFYAKQGFQQIGTKRFRVGARLEHDLVLERRLRGRTLPDQPTRADITVPGSRTSTTAP